MPLYEYVRLSRATATWHLRPVFPARVGHPLTLLCGHGQPVYGAHFVCDYSPAPRTDSLPAGHRICKRCQTVELLTGKGDT